MPLVGRVGRNRPRARLAMAVLYIVLSLGALTTVYPFASMVSLALKGPSDQNDGRFVPGYLVSDTELLAKYRHDKYANDADAMASASIGAQADQSAVAAYREFLMALPPDQWSAAFTMPTNAVSSRLSERWQHWLQAKYGTIQAVGRAYNDFSGDFLAVTPVAEQLGRANWKPTPGPRWSDWLEFKATLPVEFRLPVRADRMFQQWARAKWENQFARVPAEAAGSAKKFEEMRLPSGGAIREEFLEHGLPERFRAAGTVEGQWQRIHPGPLPVLAEEADWVAIHRSDIAGEMATRNFRYVIRAVFTNGRAALNTTVFCLLAVLAQLTVNPLAAYALSRYPMKATARILVFLLATMAFPAEVTMIPAFLQLKELHLLNTFAALVLPGAASGYMVFLLKGFFDSLPREVFESGQIDGAKEMTMLWKLALPLSKPVLGYLALMAFMGAYGSFLYAFLVAQDRNIWTLMVFVYQLQQAAPKAVMMAAVTLVALPTLVVFLAAQRVIMRGIVLPGER
ncbi:MAG: carbohydrate ABC transporter permease [Armatimonadetes bacterium]|nr:carbohydrate ABC transporter permease [Armatimonadota bacterium]